ncbi:NAD-dependent epimerase/dehydratase family protein [Streptomyces sp. NBC_01214]|uniref:NAD-dependent epimerase/dehydratase family protein n=1 Tax=Streptomyces sp. NBC_01214 TaxID=2903777 RepID=UPI00225A8C56|nr:NAD-dependent epimerase/dehydratase family protein [Streptomyces sp. NBC_01214]MCX4803684.1 NAD-dependent epimerase/dehydratase family protein [Streptomyces sp. NBC_01214]
MKRILVIGGSRYFGKALVTRAREAGDEVTVLNRGSGAPPRGVDRLVADRDDEEALRAALGRREFDVVVDQVCYTPLQAAVARRVFAGRTGRYVMTSTMEVYDPATLPAGPVGPGPVGPVPAPAVPAPAVPVPAVPVPVTEASLDPARLPLPGAAGRAPGPWPAYVYAEGKRQAEAVFLRDPAFPYVSVRAAHVLGGGPAEFTGRLAHYVERIAAGTPVDVHKAPYATSFIHHHEMAEFLHWTAGQTFTGPVNAASHGAPDVLALCEAVAERVGRRPRYRVVGAGAAASPFSFDRAYAMDNGRASALGFGSGHVADWLPGAITETAAAAG